MDVNSLAHTKWNCKYHVVFAPKFRRKIIYNKLRGDIQQYNYLYDGSIGNESELNDEIVIWMYEIMKLRKKLIEMKGDK